MKEAPHDDQVPEHFAVVVEPVLKEERPSALINVAERHGGEEHLVQRGPEIRRSTGVELILVSKVPYAFSKPQAPVRVCK